MMSAGAGGGLPLPSGPAAAILGGFLLHLVMGTVYTWGSLTVYLTSYLRVYDESITYNDTILIYACMIAGQAALMFLGGKLEIRVGPRAAATLGSCFLVGGPLLASRVTSLWAMLCTYGLLFGFGGGLTYTVPLVCGYRWEPNRKGLVSGVVLSGFGLSALVFNQVGAAFCNPDNLKPEVEYKGKRYFAPGPVTDAVPGMLVKLGLIYGVLCLCGVALLQDPLYKKIEERSKKPYSSTRPARHDSDGSASSSTSSSPLRRRLCEDDGESACLPEEELLQDAGGYDGLEGGEVVDEDGELADDKADEAALAQYEQEEEDVTPQELVRLPQAWHVSLSFTLGALSGLVALATYKSVGIVTFVDDHFMSFVVGSFSSLANALGRVFWGWSSDRLGSYRALYTLCLCQAAFLFTWGLTVSSAWANKWWFAVWVAGITFSHGGNFAIYPALIATLFGKTNAAANFGLIFLGYGTASLVGLSVLPRLSTQLSPLNYILGLIALLSAGSVYCLHSCYHGHGSKEDRRARRRRRRARQLRQQLQGR